MSLNKRHNLTNPNQGSAKKVLCVCSAGLLRSPTLAEVLTKKYGYNCRAVGSDQEYALIPITSDLIHWADEVVFIGATNKANSELLFAKELEDKDVKLLEVLDMYEFRNASLIKKLKKLYADLLMHNDA